MVLRKWILVWLRNFGSLLSPPSLFKRGFMGDAMTGSYFMCSSSYLWPREWLKAESSKGVLNPFPRYHGLCYLASLKVFCWSCWAAELKVTAGAHPLTLERLIKSWIQHNYHNLWWTHVSHKKLNIGSITSSLGQLSLSHLHLHCSISRFLGADFWARMM